MTGGYRRVILIGFMGAGKSAVGRRVARAVGWRHVDLDDEIRRATGRTIADIFEKDGEEAFRRLEREHARRWLAEPDLVLSPGGGWALEADRAGVDDGTLVVWLRVSPGVAVRRARGADRPLLAGPDPLATARSLLRVRTPAYERLADLIIDVDQPSADHVAREVVGRLRRPA